MKSNRRVQRKIQRDLGLPVTYSHYEVIGYTLASSLLVLIRSLILGFILMLVLGEFGFDSIGYIHSVGICFLVITLAQEFRNV